ncbi:putative oxidoreductase [Hafnia alvei]|nr:putative oxidoreductase [Hafnia alvei]
MTFPSLLEDPKIPSKKGIILATVRSHDQYNTTIYGMDDRYRGVYGQRDVLFISKETARSISVNDGERVNIIALKPDGTRSDRRMNQLKVVIYKMADKTAVTYFPESNHMITLDQYDKKSGIPAYKNIPIEIEICN